MGYPVQDSAAAFGVSIFRFPETKRFGRVRQLFTSVRDEPG